MTATPAAASPPPAPTPARKKSLARLLLRIVGALVLLLVLGLVVLYLSRNSLVRAGVIRGGQFATDQNTTLDTADLGLFAGTLQLNTLGIDNLKGYKEPHLLTMKSCEVNVQTPSLFTDTVVIPTIAISGLEITIEQDGMKNNLNELIEVLKKKSPATGDTTKTSPGKQLKINHIQLAATRVHIRLLGFNKDFDLGPIQMDDPTNPDGRLPKIADLVSKVLLHVAQQIMDDPQLPNEVRQQMKQVQAVVDNLRGQLAKENSKLKNLQKDFKGLTTNPADAFKNSQNLGKDVKDMQNLGKDLQNLLPKKDPGK